MKIDLAKWINENPGATFTVDNDWWTAVPKGAIEDENTGEYEGSINAEDVIAKGDGGYGSGHCYGGDILQALAEIVGVKIESV